MPPSYGHHCIGCPYNGSGTRPLAMESNPGDVLLIFQAPGAYEWLSRRPISSGDPRSAAARVRNSLVRIGKNRKDFSITNAVQCYPGRNRNRDKAPKAEARRKCANWLKCDIGSRKWRRVVVFGKIAENIVKELKLRSYGNFEFVKHPSGGLSNRRLDRALR